MGKYDQIFFEPLPKSSISEEIIDRITEAIISGELKPGDKIPTEVEFSEKLGVGRNSVREATKILAAYGVLEIRRSEGTFVVEKFNQKMLDPMVYGILLESNSMIQLLELKITFLRSILYMAVQKATDDDIKRLRKQYNILRDIIRNHPDSIEKLYIANMNFHKFLANACQNPLITQMNYIILKMSKYSRIRGIKTVMNDNKLEDLLEIDLNLLRLLEKRDIDNIEPVIENTFEFWKKIVL